jgi:Ankyrin repeats (3 copies)
MAVWLLQRSVKHVIRLVFGLIGAAVICRFDTWGYSHCNNHQGLGLLMKTSIRQTISALVVVLMYTISCSAPAQSPQAGGQETRRKSAALDRPFCPPDEVDSRFCAEGTPNHRASNCTSLMMAAETGQLDRVRSLLASRAEVDTRGPQGITALGLAAGAGHLEVVKLLLAAGANPNILGGSFHGGLSQFGWQP